MHKLLTLVVLIFFGAVTGAAATYQPVKSAGQTDPISYISAWSHPGMQSVAPRVPAAPSNSSLRMAQFNCSACSYVYQQQVGQCRYFRNNHQQYAACIQVARGYAAQCTQMCASGGGYGGGGYGYRGQNVPLCQQFPNNPACRR